jgi:hypothetical protein
VSCWRNVFAHESTGGIDHTFKGDYHKNHRALLPSCPLPPEPEKASYKRRCHGVPLITRDNLEEMKVFRKIIAVILSGSMIFAGLSSSVSAAVIGTQQALNMESRQARITQIQASLSRDEVQKAMIGLGVDPAQASARVAALSDQELAQLDRQIENLPAGGSTLALIGAVFVVLLILELTGIIDIFKKA